MEPAKTSEITHSRGMTTSSNLSDALSVPCIPTSDENDPIVIPGRSIGVANTTGPSPSRAATETTIVRSATRFDAHGTAPQAR